MSPWVKCGVRESSLAIVCVGSVRRVCGFREARLCGAREVRVCGVREAHVCPPGSSVASVSRVWHP